MIASEIIDASVRPRGGAMGGGGGDGGRGAGAGGNGSCKLEAVPRHRVDPPVVRRGVEAGA
jgi:hypothetical protein